MEQRIALVTGATAGIGLATATELTRRGHRVILGARGEDRAEAARVHVLQHTGVRPDVLYLDLADLDTVRAAADQLTHRVPRLDVLVNSAGHTFLEHARTVQGHEASFGVNVLGPFLLTSLLEPLLAASFKARIVDLAGIYALRGEIDVDDLFFDKRGFDLWRVANTTQQARVMLVEERAHRLPPHVTINAVHPGAVLTDAQKHLPWHVRLLLHTVMRPGFVKPPAGAAPVVHLATSPQLEGVTGRFFRRFREQPTGHDPAVTGALWVRCLDLVAPGDMVDLTPRTGRNHPAPTASASPQEAV